MASSFIPSAFSGLSSEDAAEFITDVENWFKFRKLNNEEIKGCFHLLLHDSAKYWYSALEDKEKNSFDRIKAAFAEQYMRDSATAYQDMSTMVAAKQELLEKVEVYIARILRLARKAAASYEQILFGITNGLLPHIRQHALTQNCRSVEDIRKCSLIAKTASSIATDTSSLLRRLEAKFDALAAQPSLPIPIPQPPMQTFFPMYSQPYVRLSFSADNRWKPTQSTGYRLPFRP